jgi:hypothetical protein
VGNKNPTLFKLNYMASECTTNILFESSEKGIKWLKEKITEVKKLNKEDRFNYISENFSLEGKTNIERLGTKWLDIDDCEETDEGYTIQVRSAAYPPKEMVIKLVSLLRENFDKNSRASGKYWDENFNTIGIFESNSTGYYDAEDSLDVDFDNEDYWEDEVEPAFDKLEL